MPARASTSAMTFRKRVPSATTIRWPYGGCSASEQRAPVHQLPAASRDRGEELESHQVCEWRYADAGDRRRLAQRPRRLSAAGDVGKAPSRTHQDTGIHARADAAVDPVQDRQVNAQLEVNAPVPAARERTEAAAFVRIEQVTKKFGDFAAVDAVSLDIQQGRFSAFSAAPAPARPPC